MLEVYGLVKNFLVEGPNMPYLRPLVKYFY